MNVIKEIERINKREADHGIYGGMGKGSWHDKYKNSAWVYVGGLSYELSEGDIICVMSQWGEIEDINLVREKGTNKSMGFAFIKYEDQRSTILAVDNFNGISLLGRVLRCDHVDQYKLPKHIREQEEAKLEEDPSLDIHIGPGHAYSGQELENGFSVTKGMDLWSTTARGIGVAVDAARPTNEDNGKVYDKSEDDSDTEKDRSKKKKHKHHKSKHSKKRDRSEHSDNYDRDKADDRHKTKSADGYRRRRSRSRSKERSIRKRSRSRSMDGDRGEGVSKGNNLSTPSVNAVNKNSGAAYNTLPHMADNGGAAASWRGVRDPVSAAPPSHQNRPIIPMAAIPRHFSKS